MLNPTGEGLASDFNATSATPEMHATASTALPAEPLTSAPTFEPWPSVPMELRRPEIDRAQLVADGGRVVLIWFGLFILYGSQHPISAGALLGLTVATGIWVVALRSASLTHPAVPVRMAASALGTAIGFGVVAALDETVVGLHVSLASLVLFALGVLGSVLLWDRIVHSTLDARKRVLLVGSGHADEILAEELRMSPDVHIDVVGAVPAAEEIAEIVDAQCPDIVVLTDDEMYDAAVERLLDSHANVQVTGFESFFEYAFGRVPIDQITPAWFMSLLHPRQRIYTRFTKRAFDVVVALIGLILSAPLFGALALATKLTGGEGPVFYRQTRIGEYGRRFTIYKFRSMKCDAEDGGAVFASKDDPRTTGVGCFLRRTHLDELPQLWNVLKGDMSIVGPRPERPEFIDMIEEAVPFWNRRLLVKPGVTGWAQVRCGYASDCEAMEVKLSYDLWYLRHRSLLVDLEVCAMTLSSLFARPRGT